ncbi:MAG: hypothetical protein GY801_43120 [bacterium]|nr:hypothetical protein [bacterium]
MKAERFVSVLANVQVHLLKKFFDTACILYNGINVLLKIAKMQKIS